jgi:hypothetical protein
MQTATNKQLGQEKKQHSSLQKEKKENDKKEFSRNLNCDFISYINGCIK